MSEYIGMPTIAAASKPPLQFDFNELGANGIDRVGELNPYITLACDLRCSYCYMGDFLQNARNGTEVMSRNFLSGMLDTLIDKDESLDRMTFLGGEPTLHPEITEMVNDAADRNVSLLRMTTNGVSLHRLDLAKLKAGAFEQVSVSLDGITAEENNATRGKGTFGRILETLAKYKEAEVPLSVNCTVTTHNLDSVLRAPAFFRSLGVTTVNFHRASQNGTAKNSQDILVGASQWVDARDQLLDHLRSNREDYAGMTFRVPYTYLTNDQMKALDYRPIQENNYYSPGGGQRLIVLPPTPKGQGLCFISSDLIDVPGTEIGRIDQRGTFRWNPDPKNELTAYRTNGSSNPNISTYLTEQDTDGDPVGLRRVSHSFKAVIEC